MTFEEIFFKLIYFERGKQCTLQVPISRGGSEREGGRESQAGFILLSAWNPCRA